VTVDVAEWRLWSGNPTTPDSSLVTAALSSATTAIRGALARAIVLAGETATARVYAPRGTGSLLSIHDAAAVTTVVDNGTTLTLGTDYQLEPLNGITRDGEYSPYTHLRRLSGWWTHDNDKATVTVTARWGWTTVPDRFDEAVKVLTSDILGAAETRNGIIAFADYGAVRARENPTVALLLNGLHRAESIGFA
jgi:hypothetical protein